MISMMAYFLFGSPIITYMVLKLVSLLILLLILLIINHVYLGRPSTRVESKLDNVLKMLEGLKL